MNAVRYVAASLAVVCPVILGTGCSSSSGVTEGGFEPSEIEGFWSVEIDNTINTCDPGGPDDPYTEVFRFEAQGNLVRVQIWNAEIGCPDPGEWDSFPVGFFNGNTFTVQGQDIDDQRPAVDCVSTWDSVFSFTFADPAVSGFYNEQVDYEGTECPGFDCTTEDSASGMRCDPAVCWPCPM